MNLRVIKSVKERRGALESGLGVMLGNIGTYSLDEGVASARNCENMIGVSQVPMGVAGPVKIGTKEYYIPLSTTEGALVASINRGAKALTQSGGAKVSARRIGATRGPVFRVKNIVESEQLSTFLEENLDKLKEIARSTSSHLTLEKFMTTGAGRYRYVRFVFHTDDAMGMNMVTFAAAALVKFVEEKTGAVCIALAGNFDTDKKTSWLNIIEHRGFQVQAEIVLQKATLANTLKTSAANMYEVWLAKCMIGSALSGSMGFNAHIANVIAAIFLATGQDLGHVGEGSVGITTAEIDGDDLYMSVMLPDLMVGIVGGGTGLATQQEALRIIGASTSPGFAQVIGAAVLAGEVSLLASLAQGSLAKAHSELARGKK